MKKIAIFKNINTNCSRRVNVFVVGSVACCVCLFVCVDHLLRNTNLAKKHSDFFVVLPKPFRFNLSLGVKDVGSSPGNSVASFASFTALLLLK